uniref:Uncharacterized protein n=1 Tax=Clytia hemisphaerica TaxID=252671 RepID=A0A7M5VFD5_9CNID
MYLDTMNIVDKIKLDKEILEQLILSNFFTFENRDSDDNANMLIPLYFSKDSMMINGKGTFASSYLSYIQNDIFTFLESRRNDHNLRLDKAENECNFYLIFLVEDYHWQNHYSIIPLDEQFEMILDSSRYRSDRHYIYTGLSNDQYFECEPSIFNTLFYSILIPVHDNHRLVVTDKSLMSIMNERNLGGKYDSATRIFKYMYGIDKCYNVISKPQIYDFVSLTTTKETHIGLQLSQESLCILQINNKHFQLLYSFDFSNNRRDCFTLQVGKTLCVEYYSNLYQNDVGDDDKLICENGLEILCIDKYSSGNKGRRVLSLLANCYLRLLIDLYVNFKLDSFLNLFFCG